MLCGEYHSLVSLAHFLVELLHDTESLGRSIALHSIVQCSIALFLLKKFIIAFILIPLPMMEPVLYLLRT